MAREIGPTLPKYIVIMMIHLPIVFRLGVRFLVRPTVAVALTVSYAMSNEEASVTAESNSVEVNMIANDMHTTAIALLTACFAICLPKRSTSSLLRMEDIAEAAMTAKVTVLMPPAVPTGEPPMNIKSRQAMEVALVKFSCGSVAKPAVLVVTD